MDRHEALLRARAFATLDNVTERESPNWMEMKKNSGLPLDPALNPHIDHEAVEAGDSDSDLAQDDNDSFIASDSSLVTVSTTDNGSRGEEKGKSRVTGREETAACCEWDYDGTSDHSSQEGETLYDDFVASRKVIEAQIDADERKRKRYQFCESSDEDQTISSNNSYSGSCGNSENDSEMSRGKMEAEEEASFSSVVGHDA